jgi:UDP-N-acetylmuramate dehydrogenase
MIKDVMKVASLIRAYFPEAKLNESLADKTTFGVGGKTLAYLHVRTPEELWGAVSLAKKKKISYQIIAGGSNVVFAEKIYPALVIQYFNKIGRVEIDDSEVVVDASLPLMQLIRAVMRSGLAGIETLSGIPGTVGGAVVGNAGAYGQSISDHLDSVLIYDGQKTKWVNKKACHFAYRDRIFKHKDPIVLRVKFKLGKGDRKELEKKSREIIEMRNKKYPPGTRCPGSFFKNVLAKEVSQKSLKLLDRAKIAHGKIPAGYLLEAVGAKGMKQGKIYVADYHGNLIINGGKGKCVDVKKLATKLKQKVYNKFKIKLEEEVRFI